MMMAMIGAVEGELMGEFVVVVEAGLSASGYGAKISLSDPMVESVARSYMEEVLRGEHADFCKIAGDARILRVSGADQWLVVGDHRLSSTTLTRLSLAESTT